LLMAGEDNEEVGEGEERMCKVYEPGPVHRSRSACTA